MDRRFAGESPGEEADVSAPTAGGRAAAAAPITQRRSLRVLALTMFLATAAFSGFEATFALLGQVRFDWTEGSVAAVFVLIGIALVVVQGGLIGPAVAHFGQLPTLRAALVLNAAGLLLLAGATRWPLLIPALALLVLGQGLAMPTITSLVSERARDERRGQALGFQQSAGALARIVGPAAAGLLFQHVGVPWPYLVGAAAMGLALAVLGTRLPAGDEPGPLEATARTHGAPAPARPAGPPREVRSAP
jgi:MFS family permease